jgi:hypothetical protein
VETCSVAFLSASLHAAAALVSKGRLIACTVLGLTPNSSAILRTPLVRPGSFRAHGRRPYLPLNLNEMTRVSFERTAQMEGEQIASDIYPTRPNPLAAPAAARGQYALLVGPPR